MKIKRLDFPESSVLYPEKERYDYTDSYGGTFCDPENNVRIEEIVSGFVKPLPASIGVLMSIRDSIVKLFGLKTTRIGLRNNHKEPLRYVKGEKVGFFTFYSRTDNEVILGEDDKHLDFRVSVLVENLKHEPGMKRAIITTVVTYNNWLGSFYFFFVKPFHRILVPKMLKTNYKYLAD
jgi:hypothetical protein